MEVEVRIFENAVKIIPTGVFMFSQTQKGNGSLFERLISEQIIFSTKLE